MCVCVHALLYVCGNVCVSSFDGQWEFQPAHPHARAAVLPGQAVHGDQARLCGVRILTLTRSQVRTRSIPYHSNDRSPFICNDTTVCLLSYTV